MISIWDVLDILIVGLLLYYIYKLLRGTVAFNIFFWILILYVIWWLVGILNMDLLSMFLTQFVSVGVIILIIIFQPEVRKFLLLLGNTTLKGHSNFLSSILDKSSLINQDQQKNAGLIQKALSKMAKTKTGALIVMGDKVSIQNFSESGTMVNGLLSQSLIESIFNKFAPLHDGAVLISEGLIIAASCILPVSENKELPNFMGLRHRAALGVTENSNLAAFTVSEETGKISYAYQGKIEIMDEEGTLLGKILKHSV